MISNEKETLLSIYLENGKVKIHSFVEGDVFHGENMLFDALVFAIASSICKRFEHPKERKEYLETVKRRIELLLETKLEEHPLFKSN